MALKRCEQGHYYDPEQHSSCPSCGIPGLDVTPTRGKKPDPIGDTSSKLEATHRHGEAPDLERPGRTVGIFHKRTGIDPVVGWLVCIEGPDRGRDYRIHSERNFIGRDPSMDICVSGDETISRHKHAIVSFDTKKSAFKLLPGEGRGQVYLNDAEVDMPTKLNAHDTIELGQTKLIFVPLCGEQFSWE